MRYHDRRKARRIALAESATRKSSTPAITRGEWATANRFNPSTQQYETDTPDEETDV